MVERCVVAAERGGLSRRIVLSAALSALPCARAMSATLIDAAPSAGTGGFIARRREIETTTSDAAESFDAGKPREHELARGARERGDEQPLAWPQDWKDFLLSGERSVLMSRGPGAAVRVRYRLASGEVDPQGYATACYLLRDVRANRMVAMDPRLLDVMCGIQRWLAHKGRDAVIEVTSGFRTRQTNDVLEGAAKNSMHLQGRAADVIIRGLDPRVLGAMALEFNRVGGTGIYVSKSFVHIDTGSPRMWVKR